MLLLHPLRISLSYTPDAAWIALFRDGHVGVDAMPLNDFAEREDVARLYLGPKVSADIVQATNPIHTFALAWTSWEAQLKCLDQNLHEWPANTHTHTSPLLYYIYHWKNTIVTIVTKCNSQ